jgi:hypothetical protein
VVLRDIREGLGWLWNQPVIRFLTLTQTADNLRYGSGYLVIIALAEAVRATPTQIGLVFTGAAVGALAGSLLADRAVSRFSLGHIAVVMLWAEALIFPLYVLAPNPLCLGIVAAAESVIAPVYWVAIGSYRLLLAPDTLRGRTSAAVQALTTGALSLGTMLGGTLIAVLGARGATLALAGWLGVLALATTLNRQVRSTRGAVVELCRLCPPAPSFLTPMPRCSRGCGGTCHWRLSMPICCWTGWTCGRASPSRTLAAAGANC